MVRKQGGGSGICILFEMHNNGSRNSRKTFFSNVDANFNLSRYILYTWICSLEQAAQYTGRAIEPEKIVGVEMAPDKFELSMQVLLDRGSTSYCRYTSVQVLIPVIVL